MRRAPVRIGVIALILAAALLVIGGVGAAPKGGLTASLSVAQDSFGSSQDVLVTVTLANPTKHPLRVLSWFTPENGVDEPIFTVTRDGEAVSYVGAHTKRPAAAPGDYLTIASGSQITRSVDLGEFYDLSKSGRYEIAYRVAAYGLFDDRGAGSSSRAGLESRVVSIKVDGRATKGKPGPPPTGGFTACSTTQQTQLTSARTDARAYATNAAAYLNAGIQGLRYTTWFGLVTTNRYNTVQGNFGTISTAMNSANITFDCSSKRNVYAYVYPNQPYRIYLGRVFWTAPPTGTDSKAGTLIHEMSHFTVVAGTDDVVYGQTGARSLAATDPDSAIRNADSHEYFAENTPSQP
jgi:peptidyl-Lys metalloendopeptidase